MSKLTKFIRSPVRFYADAIKNRLPQNPTVTDQTTTGSSNRTTGDIYVIGFSTWKQYLRRYFPDRNLIFLPKNISDQDFRKIFDEKILKDKNSQIFIWGFKASDYVLSLLARSNGRARFVEDGFIRSINLGATKAPPMSLCFDAQTPYFDARSPSDLETLLATYDFQSDTDLRKRSLAAIDLFIRRGVSKYNFTSRSAKTIDYDQTANKRVLVIGQVEDDASISFGCDRKISNNDLVRLAAAENPDAQIIYKPHPDVWKGFRKNISDPNEVRSICTIIEDDLSLPQAFVGIDHVYTITSLAGFEALLRGIKVTVLGCPFYAGWGLTDDRQPNARRTRKLAIEDVFAASYILYPRYFDPTNGQELSVEEVIHEIGNGLDKLDQNAGPRAASKQVPKQTISTDLKPPATALITKARIVLSEKKKPAPLVNTPAVAKALKASEVKSKSSPQSNVPAKAKPSAPSTSAITKSPAATNVLPMHDKLSSAARAAAQKGDWAAAAEQWRKVLNLPVEPYVGLSDALFAQGDAPGAEDALRDGLTAYPDNAVLLERYCQLALKGKRWSEVTTRWSALERTKANVPAQMRLAIAEAFIQTGDLNRAEVQSFKAAATGCPESSFLRIKALLAQGRQQWAAAADCWLARAAISKGIGQIASYKNGLNCLLRSEQLERASSECIALIQRFPDEVAFLKQYAEIAIAQDAWAVALERWQSVETLNPADAGAMPREWIFKIGLENARERTAAIKIRRLQSIGMMSIARAIENVDEVGALVLARKARGHYGDDVRNMIARILSTNTRHSAAIWWLRHLIEKGKDPKSYYPLLVDALIESSRLEECEQVIETYVAAYGRDTLWLRAAIEIAYRRGDFLGMRQIMQEAASTKLPTSGKAVRVTKWLHELIRVHPEPSNFLPEEIHHLLTQIAAIYDTKFIASSIEMLLTPSVGDTAAITYLEQIKHARLGTHEISAVMQEEMLQFFIRRRDWSSVHALLDLPLLTNFDPQKPDKTWNIIRIKTDILLGEAKCDEAELVACEFLDLLAEHQLDGFAAGLASNLLSRLPTSEKIASRLVLGAHKIGFTQVARRIENWKKRFGGVSGEDTVGIADRHRCFIVGNAPSIASLPLHLLEGEDIFCVNRGMRALDIGLPQPKYLAVADHLVYKNHAQEIDNDGASVDKFFVAANCLWRQLPTVPSIPIGSSGLKLTLAPFKHQPLHLHRGDSVVVLAAQLAHLMGYKEIYIIGVDLDYSGPSTHFYTSGGNGQKEIERLANFRPGGSGCELVNLAFANLQRVVADDECRIFNASPSGKLDSIPRVNFEELFEPKSSDLARPADTTPIMPTYHRSGAYA